MSCEVLPPRSFAAWWVCSVNLALVACLLCLVPNVITARRANKPPPPNWVNSLTQMLQNDAEFAASLEVLRDSPETVDYCSLPCVICDEEGMISGLYLKNFDGVLDFSSVYESVTDVTFVHGMFRQPPDLSTIPPTVKTLRFFNCRFSISSSLVMRKRHTKLHTFGCSDCDLDSVDWSSLAPVMHLDLSDNPRIKQLDFRTLPATLRTLNVSNCDLRMDVSSLENLPQPLLSFDGSRNGFSGELRNPFPPYLETLSLSHNLIEGPIVQDVMPFSLVQLDLSHNRLSGDLGDMKQLSSLRVMELQNNRISKVHWNSFPPQLESLKLGHNELSGWGPLYMLPATLTYLDLSFNKLDGSLDLMHLPPKIRYLDVQSNQFAGAVKLAEVPKAIQFLYIQNNKLSGKADLLDLPVDIRRVLVHGNDFEPLYSLISD